MWHKCHYRPLLCLEQTSLINPSPHGVRMGPGPAAPGSPKQSILQVPPVGPAAVAHGGHASPPDVEVEWISPACRALSLWDRKAAAAPNSTRPAGALRPRCPGVRSFGGQRSLLFQGRASRPGHEHAWECRPPPPEPLQAPQAPQASGRAQGSPSVQLGPGRRAEPRGEGKARQDSGQDSGKIRRFSLKFKQLDNLFWIDLEAVKWKKKNKKKVV